MSEPAQRLGIGKFNRTADSIRRPDGLCERETKVIQQQMQDY